MSSRELSPSANGAVRGDLAGLLARVEAAVEPDRELDRDIVLWQFPEMRDWPRTNTGGWMSPVWGRVAPPEPYTASHDAPQALCERVLPGVWYIVGKGKLCAGEPVFGAQLLFGDNEVLGEGEHEHGLALAVIAALLKALIADAASPADRQPNPREDQ